MAKSSEKFQLCLFLIPSSRAQLFSSSLSRWPKRLGGHANYGKDYDDGEENGGGDGDSDEDDKDDTPSVYDWWSEWHLRWKSERSQSSQSSILAKNNTYTTLGKPPLGKTDEFSENFRTAFDPPAPFSENILQFFGKPDQTAPNLQWYFSERCWWSKFFFV